MLSADADGVHLGFDALDPAAAASLLPDSALIGVSLHSVREVEMLAEKSQNSPQLYTHLAPIWNPVSKPVSRPALGPDQLSNACGSGSRILAQGGLDPARAVQALRAHGRSRRHHRHLRFGIRPWRDEPDIRERRR